MEPFEVTQPGLDAADQLRQQWCQGAGSLVHPGLSAPLVAHAAAHVLVADGAGRRPLDPIGFLQRPLRQVQVEGTDDEQDSERIGSRFPPVGFAALEQRPFLPATGNGGRQVQAVDTRVVLLQILPEVAGKVADEADQRAVVDRRSAFGEVANQQFTNWLALNVVGVDEFGDGALSTWRAARSVGVPAGKTPVSRMMSQLSAMLLACLISMTAAW